MILSHSNPTICREDEKAPAGPEEVILQDDMRASRHGESDSQNNNHDEYTCSYNDNAFVFNVLFRASY